MALVDPDPAKRWPNGVVPYAFTPQVSSVASRLAVAEAAIVEWRVRTHLRFVPRAGEAGYLRFAVIAAGGCQSNVGHDGGAHNVNCQFDKLGIVLHEMGHALGLIHEHQRPDRDAHVTVDVTTAPNKDAFEITDEHGWLSIGPYDCVSIMHYDMTDPYISSTPGGCTTWGSQTHVSAGDGAAIRSLYRLVRRGDSGDQAGSVSEISLCSIGEAGRVVTAVRSGSGRLVLITWDVGGGGTVTRRGDSAKQAGAATHNLVAAVPGTNDVLTASRTEDSGNDAGQISASATVDRAIRGNEVVSAVRDADGDLKLIQWLHV